MKSLFTIVAILTLSCSPSFGTTLDFPNSGDIMFKITIPDDWEPNSDDDEVVEAQSPEANIQISIWEIETKEDLKNLGNVLEDILKDHAKEIKLVGEPKAARPGGMEGLLISGTALDEDDDHEIQFFALLVTNKVNVAIVFIEANANTPEVEAKKLEKILKSITPGGKKLLTVKLAVDADSKPIKAFKSDAPKIHAFVEGNGFKKGDVIKSVWFAEDVGDAAAKNSKVDEASTTAMTATDVIDFFLSKQKDGDWPVGKYRVEISVNDQLIETAKYKIENE